MPRSIAVGLVLASVICPADAAGPRLRTELKIPDVPGYAVMACDFHMHTVFSDGNVWPHVRAEEAWREGLHALAITDHIEYQPHRDDVPTNHNRPYELARGHAELLGLVLVRGSEITRKVPPGHFNAIFLNDCVPLDVPEFFDAMRAAAAQDAFIFWNHPPFGQVDGKSIWHPVHSELLGKGLLHGIEVVNGGDYYPEAHAWCLEKKLTMIGSSDVHNPIFLDYDFAGGEHRPMTLAFAKERTEEGLKEALFARRTVVYWRDVLIGEPEFLEPLFRNALGITAGAPRNGRVSVQITNRSGFDFALASRGAAEGASAPQAAAIPAGRTVFMTVQTKDLEPGIHAIRLPYTATNLLAAPGEGLPVTLDVTVEIAPGR